MYECVCARAHVCGRVTWEALLFLWLLFPPLAHDDPRSVPRPIPQNPKDHSPSMTCELGNLRPVASPAWACFLTCTTGLPPCPPYGVAVGSWELVGTPRWCSSSRLPYRALFPVEGHVLSPLSCTERKPACCLNTMHRLFFKCTLAPGLRNGVWRGTESPRGSSGPRGSC